MTVAKKEYVWSRTAWLPSVWAGGSDRITDEVILTVHGSGYSADFAVRWHELGNAGNLRNCPRVEAFSDSWKGLDQVMPALIILDDKDPTPEEFIREIERFGFEPGEYHGQLTEPRRMSVTVLKKKAKEGDGAAVDELVRRLVETGGRR